MRVLKKTPSDWKISLLERYMTTIESSIALITKQCYEREIEEFLNYLPKKTKLKDIDSYTITSYYKYLRDAGKAESTIIHRNVALKGFFNWLRAEGYIYEDIFLKIKTPRITKKAPYVPSCEEVGRLLDAVKLKTKNGIRDRAILEILYSTGMRVSELCELEMKDYQGSKITIRSSKSNEYRTVPLIAVAKEFLDKYLEQNRERPYEQKLFVTETGKAMDRSLIYVMLKTLGKKVGIKQKISPHTLRHACATHLLEHGVDLISIQQLLGHTNISTTQIYVHLSANRMHSNVLASHPRGGL